MNKNRLSRPPAMRRRGTTQRSRRSSRGGKGGGRAGKQRALTWGDPDGTTRWGVSRGRSTGQRAGGGNARVNEETGRLDVGKGRTEREDSDGVEDTEADEAGRRGRGECRHDRKHGSSQE